MKKEWTEQDLREFVRSAQAAFENVTLTEADEEAARSWQDDGLMVDYELRNGQVDCVLRRQIVADGPAPPASARRGPAPPAPARRSGGRRSSHPGGCRTRSQNSGVFIWL